MLRRSLAMMWCWLACEYPEFIAPQATRFERFEVAMMEDFLFKRP
jgi:hypothetical protein